MQKMKITAVLLGLLLLAGCSTAAPVPTETTTQPSQGVQAQQTLFFRRENGITGMISRLSPSVVGLAVTVGAGADSTEGLGTGFFVDESGYILTNHHVAGEAASITVVMEDGSRLAAHRVWSDQVLDLAVVKCDEGGPFTPVTLGSVEQVKVGDPVAAVGTPLDLSFQHTVTAGIVSGMNRTLQVPTSTGLSFLEELKRDAGVCDLIYSPARTALLTRAEELGLRVSNGLGMLVWQAVFALEQFTGMELDRPAMAAAARRALEQAGS